MSSFVPFDAGHVYIVTFSDGIVKVGGTQNIKQRLSSVKSLGRHIGGEPLSSLVFTHQHVGIGEALTRRMARRSGGVALNGYREWLQGVDLQRLVLRLHAFWPVALSDARTELWVNPKTPPHIRGSYIFNRADIDALPTSPAVAPSLPEIDGSAAGEPLSSERA